METVGNAPMPPVWIPPYSQCLPYCFVISYSDLYQPPCTVIQLYNKLLLTYLLIYIHYMTKWVNTIHAINSTKRSANTGAILYKNVWGNAPIKGGAEWGRLWKGVSHPSRLGRTRASWAPQWGTGWRLNQKRILAYFEGIGVILGGYAGRSGGAVPHTFYEL